MKPTDHPVFLEQWRSTREIERSRRDQRMARAQKIRITAVNLVCGLICVAIGAVLGMVVVRGMAP